VNFLREKRQGDPDFSGPEIMRNFSAHEISGRLPPLAVQRCFPFFRKTFFREHGTEAGFIYFR